MEMNLANFFCYWCVPLWTQLFNIFEYGGICNPFLNIASTLLIFFSDSINFFERHLIFPSSRDQIVAVSMVTSVFLGVEEFRPWNIIE